MDECGRESKREGKAGGEGLGGGKDRIPEESDTTKKVGKRWLERDK